jgi:hypothetical protein
VAAQGDRARRTRAAATPRPVDGGRFDEALKITLLRAQVLPAPSVYQPPE